MKRSIFIFFCICTVAFFSLNARTIRDFFVSEPNNIFMLFDKNVRLDLLDYFDAGRIVSAKNNLSDGTQLIAVKPNYIAIRTTPSSTVEMKLLFQSKADTVIAVIQTVSLPGKDSQISFYDTRWNKLSKKHIFREPTIKDFIKDKSRIKEVLGIAEIPLISYSFNPEKDGLTAHQNLKEIVSEDDYAKIAPYLLDSLTYSAQGLKYKLIK